MSELRPCPWCGIVRPAIVDGETTKYVLVACLGCGAKGPDERRVITGQQCEEDRRRAIAAWNTRAPDPLREALLWFYVGENVAGSCEWLGRPEQKPDALRLRNRAAINVDRELDLAYPEETSGQTGIGAVEFDAIMDRVAKSNDTAGRQVTTRPQRKALPDADGYWWVKTADGAVRPRRSYEYAGVRFIIGVHVSEIEWVEGPLEVPE